MASRDRYDATGWRVDQVVRSHAGLDDRPWHPSAWAALAQRRAGRVSRGAAATNNAHGAARCPPPPSPPVRLGALPPSPSRSSAVARRCRLGAAAAPTAPPRPPRGDVAPRRRTPSAGWRAVGPARPPPRPACATRPSRPAVSIPCGCRQWGGGRMGRAEGQRRGQRGTGEGPTSPLPPAPPAAAAVTATTTSAAVDATAIGATDGHGRGWPPHLSSPAGAAFVRIHGGGAATANTAGGLTARRHLPPADETPLPGGGCLQRRDSVGGVAPALFAASWWR